MPLQLAISAEYLTASRRLHTGPCLFYGVVTLGSAAGKEVTVYDASEEDAGQTRFVLHTANQYSRAILFSVPVMFHRGLYVKLGTNVANVTVLWVPITGGE